MRMSKEINQALKTLFVFAVITSVFALLGNLGVLIPVGENTINADYFFRVIRVWMITEIVMILIILGLCVYIKIADRRFNLTFLHNPMIRVTSGLLVIFEGIINLSNKVSILIFNIQTYKQTLYENSDEIVQGIMSSNVIPILANLLQIIFGLYLVLYRKKDKAIE